MAKKLPKVIFHDDFLKVIKAVKYKDKRKERRIKASFILGFYQCMRVSEIVKLRKEDIDFKRGFIQILNAKGGKDRDSPIQEPSKKALRYIPIEYSKRTLQREWNRWTEKVLGRRYNFHRLRHGGCSFYIRKKVPLPYVQQLMGHSNISLTEIYTHIRPDHIKEAFDEVWGGLGDDI